MEYPTGTVTFLFTDMAGSTELWERHHRVMPEVVRRHDELLRSAIVANDGVLFKNVGDACCAAFANPPDALQAMVDGQRLLEAEVWPEGIELRVRMALHSGIVAFRDGDYFGRTLNRIARLLSIGYGGQCLISESTRALLRDEHLDVSLLAMGQHRLKNLDNPEMVYQVNWDGHDEEFPPLKSVDNRQFSHNLPIQTTSFLGREVESAKVLSLLQHSRLLTMTGSGGCGKSRLSLQVAADLVESVKDGVWFVELATVQDGSLLAQTITSVLKVGQNQDKPEIEVLARYLKDKDLLLVLDNCEHLVIECAHLVETLLRSCAALRILCSSREPLGINGEVTYRVPSLDFPDPKKPSEVTALTQYAAVRLFIDRALVHDPGFVVTNLNAPALAEICYRLDGIPLAIELAAARVRAFSVEEINARLHDCFKLLTAGSRTALPRQQTLRSLIGWSFDLLSAPEKALFARLSVFAGGWTLEAAEAVCGGGIVGDHSVLNLLPALVDKSLVVAVSQPNGTRYKFLETIRQFAKERFIEDGLEAEYSKRHLAYFTDLVKGGRAKLEGPDCAEWGARFDDEVDNIREALSFAFRDPEAGDAACNILGEFGIYFYHRGLVREGLEWVKRATERHAADPHGQSRFATLNIGGWLAHTNNQTDLAVRYWTDLHELAEGTSADMVGAAHNGLGLIASQHKHDYPAAVAHFEETYRIARSLGKVPTAPLMNLGHTLMSMGEYDRAEHVLAEGLDWCIRENMPEGLVSTRYVLGQVKQRRRLPT